jgi:pimeloyl-ACP methyl ester carboxylesterase
MSEAYHDRLAISYDDLGQGEPALLFLPGWCASRAAWSSLIPKSASHRRILSLDWQGHGQSETPSTDFGEEALVADALSVIKASGVQKIIPVALAHAGWIAIELRRRLGEQIPKVILIDWIIFEAPAPFLGALQALQDPTQWQQTRDHLFSMWLEGIDNSALTHFVQQDMGTHDAQMWGRAGREISAAYVRAGSPLNALSELNPPVSVLHLYAQPADLAFLQAQQSFAASHSWFHVQRLQARSHFPMFEVPDEMATAIETFVTG